MTIKHPLTDKIIREELITEEECDRREGNGRAMFYSEDFRSGADWDLKRCLEFLRTHPFHNRPDYEDLSADAYANLLEDAMRPQHEPIEEIVLKLTNDKSVSAFMSLFTHPELSKAIELLDAQATEQEEES